MPSAPFGQDRYADDAGWADKNGLDIFSYILLHLLCKYFSFKSRFFPK